MPRQPFAKARARSVARRACEPAETFSGGALATRGPSDIPGRQVLAGKLRRNALGLSCLDSEGLCAHATTIDHNFRALKSKSMVGYTGCSDAQGCRASASVPITRAWPPRRNRHVRAAASRSTSTPSSSSTHATGTSWFATGAVTCSNCSSEPSPGLAGRLGRRDRMVPYWCHPVRKRASRLHEPFPWLGGKLLVCRGMACVSSL